MVWVPSAKLSPECTTVVPSLNITGSVPSTRSVAVAANASHRPTRAGRLVGLIGNRRQHGGVVSCTVMVKLSDPTIAGMVGRAAVMVWVPSAKLSPECTTVVPSLNTTGSVPSTRSVAVAANASHRPVGAGRLVGLIGNRAVSTAAWCPAP